MAIRSGFFNSVNGDRKYDANRFAEYFASFIGNGIFPNPANNLQVLANNDMTVTVKPGKVWINGYIMINDDDYILNIEPADGVLNRIDRIVVRYDTADREIRLEIKKGTFASNPTAPELQRDADAYELGLADIYVSAGTTSITQANITDLRLSTEYCGIVHGVVDQVDTEVLFQDYQAWIAQKKNQYDEDIEQWTQQKQDEYQTWYDTTTATEQAEIDAMQAQFQQDWDTWFQTIQGILDNDTAGNLLNMLNQHKNKIISDSEVHGIRVTDGKLEYYDGSEWKSGATTKNISNTKPTENDDITAGYSQGDIWIYENYISESEYDFEVYQCIDNRAGKAKWVKYAEDKKAIVYGVEIDTTNSNPETSVTYTDDAVGFTPMSGNNGNFQWGSWQQIFEDIGIKPCLLKDGVVQYYLDPNDFTKKEDGTLADITSGNDGDVMIEFPKIYWKMWKDGTKQYVQYSTIYFDGAKCPAHTVGSVVKDKIYLPAYMGYELNGKLRSLSGKTPTANKTIGQFRTLAQANGAGYQQMTYYALLMLQVLYVVWFKNLDSQTALGRGYVDSNSSSTVTGGTNNKGMFYGSTNGSEQIKFAGIEDFWGNTFYWIDGLYGDANRNILVSNQDVFNDNGSGYENYGQGATSDTSGYIDDIQGGTETGFIIKSRNGSSTTYYCDYGSLRDGCLPRFGGSWSNGSHAGTFRLYVYNSASTSDSYLAARLCFIGS